MSSVVEERVEAAPASAALNLIDNEHPWLGLDSFSEETSRFFHGREEEIAELARRVRAKLVTILFGQSGLGKTSILRAGLVPRLRREGHCPVYVRISYSSDSPPPSEQIKRAILRETEALGRWSRPGTAVEGESLWEFLHHRDDVLQDAGGRTLIPLLVFDQFEEIFTLGQGDDFGRRRAQEFLEDLADLVENRPPAVLEQMLDADDSIAERFDFNRADYRILIAMREDYLPHLEAFKGQMPSITQNRMRLARMTGEQALIAVTRPGGRLVTEEVAESIVRFVAGGAELRNAEVEPSLLSLVCRELNNARIAQGGTGISAGLLAGSRETILQEFYERALRDQSPGVRRFIEDEMLTESGFRESLAEERVQRAFAAAGAPPGTLATLVNRRVLRIEERLDLRRVELTHDVLCKVVLERRDARHEREARDEMERQLAAERAAKAAAHKALVRARQVAAGCGVLAIAAIGSAIWGFHSSNRAQQAESRSDLARGEAEKLTGYLLEDFREELAPFGRLALMRDLAKRTVDYYRGLPAELRNPATERNRGLALQQYGAILSADGAPGDAEKMLADSWEVLDGLRKAGAPPEGTLLGLARVKNSQASIQTSHRENFPLGVKLAGEGLEILKAIPAAESSKEVLKARGNVLNNLGWMKMRRSIDGAIPDLSESREIFRKLGGAEATPTPESMGYATANIWLGEAYSRDPSGATEEAKAALREAILTTERILQSRPGHKGALHVRGLGSFLLGGILIFEDLRAAEGLALSLQGERDNEALVKIDPAFNSGWNNWGAAGATSSPGLLRLGRVRDAVRKFEEVTALSDRFNPTTFSVVNFANWYRQLAALYAMTGRPAEMRAAVAKAREFQARAFGRSGSPTGRSLTEEGGELRFAYVSLAAGEFADTRKSALAAMARMEAMEPPGATGQQTLAGLRAVALYLRGVSSYELGDYGDCVTAMRAALELSERFPSRGVQSDRYKHELRTLLGKALARLRRSREAADAIEPSVAFHRALKARNTDDFTQHAELAHALFASYLTDPRGRAAQRAEALRLMDGLPEELRRMGPFARMRDEMARES